MACNFDAFSFDDNTEGLTAFWEEVDPYEEWFNSSDYNYYEDEDYDEEREERQSRVLRETEEQLKAFYEAGDVDAFEETYNFFSDYYKDVYYVRPHGWLDSQPWYHGRPWFEDYCKRKYPQLYS